MNCREDWEKESIGSDESGKGDFFGGPTIAAVHLTKETLEILRSKPYYGEIGDSKICGDIWIKKHIEEIRSICRYEEITISPKEYNRLYDKFKNANIIFSHLHDRIHRKLEGNAPRIIDAFVNGEQHYKYMEQIGVEDPVKIDEFVTRAESKYLSVALASIIARHNYIVQMAELSKRTGVRLPFGNSYTTSNSVITAYRDLLSRGIRESFIDSSLVKNNFSTLRKIKEAIKQ